MITGEGIMAYRGTMTFNPPNPRYRKELDGDFIHKVIDGDGYWYNNGTSYPDEFCENIHEELSIAELVHEIKQKLDALRGVVSTAENLEEVSRILLKLEDELEEKGVVK